jgi:hypothetical protein
MSSRSVTGRVVATLTSVVVSSTCSRARSARAAVLIEISLRSLVLTPAV